MEDKNLVNKPVKVEQIIEAVRCFANPSAWQEKDCEDCLFWETKTLTPEDQKRYGVPVWKYCNTTKVCTMAADRLTNDQTHIAALQKEIERLRSGRRWIPVTERLPENEKDVLIAFTRKGLRGDIYRYVGMAFHTDGKTNTEDTSYSWELDNIGMEYDEEADAYIIPEGWWETVNFGENFTAVDMPVTHWMPLPEPPEVE